MNDSTDRIIRQMEEKIAELIEQVVKAERERDALAAHVERLKSLAAEEWEGAGTAIQEGGIPGELHEIFHVAMQSPETSLASLIAEKQFEALFKVLSESLGATRAETVRAFLRNAMKRARRQAEENGGPDSEDGPWADGWDKRRQAEEKPNA